MLGKVHNADQAEAPVAWIKASSFKSRTRVRR